MKIVRLRFKGGIHIGADERDIGQEKVQDIIHSDTIFSMLVNAYADIVSGNENKIQSFLNSVSCLSSGFLFEEYRPKQYKYYLPRPMTEPKNFFGKYGKENKFKYHKELKECQYVDRETFHTWISGDSINMPKIIDPDYKKLFTLRIRPQHANDRLTNASAIYHVGEMFFSRGSGLYFLIDGIEDDLLKSLLQNASFKGLGGRRSVGYGFFDFEIEPIDNKWNELFNIKGDKFITVSLYYPDDLKSLSPIAYSLILRKGWTFSSGVIGQFKRKTCRMFGEGSVFANKLTGCLVDVTPEKIFSAHRIYRFGKPLSFPCILPENGKAS